MKALIALMATSLVAAGVQAAEPAAEPAVVTSPAAASPRTAAPATAPSPASANAGRKSAGKSSASAKPAAPAASASNVELDTTQITGNRELPRVLYVVPWKRADLGELSGKPTKSLLDEVLAPVDRDVFQRQNRYHDALQPEAAAAGASTGNAAEPKVER